jgi:Na+/H+ antiporter NhaA
LLDFAKVGILAASIVAGIGGYLVLRRIQVRIDPTAEGA